jgi:hypothetical protein
MAGIGQINANGDIDQNSYAHADLFTYANGDANSYACTAALPRWLSVHFILNR